MGGQLPWLLVGVKALGTWAEVQQVVRHPVWGPAEQGSLCSRLDPQLLAVWAGPVVDPLHQPALAWEAALLGKMCIAALVALLPSVVLV